MRVLVTGAAGMLGTRLAAVLRRHGIAGGPVGQLVLADRIEPIHGPDDDVIVGDIADADYVDLLASTEPDVVFHLAAVVSAAAEADVEIGYDVNVHGLWHLLESARLNPDWTPRLVVASSVAVFSDADEAPIPESHRWAPRSTYGTQKAIGELLTADYSRRGAVDGVALRLPTIVVRTAEPNQAASTFLSSIVRAGLRGEAADIPVGRDLRAWIASPDAAVAQLLHAAALPGPALGAERCLTMPGLSVSVADLLAAVDRRGEPAGTSHLVDRPDPSIEAIVASWPPSFDCSRAEALGFVADRDVDEIIVRHLDWISAQAGESSSPIAEADANAEVSDDETDEDDVTGMDFVRLDADTTVRQPGASEPMTSYDDAAATLLSKVREFIETLGDDERQVFAAMLAPAVTEAWEADEVAGFDAWTPTRVQDHLHRAIRNERLVIQRADPEDLG
ncbi:MAG: NAD-dependent epimerase/dehydratase family protein [Acidimicrobiales bacterium]